MQKEYFIVEFGKIGRYKDFPEALLAKVVSANEIAFYNDIKRNPAYQDEKRECEKWLIFKDSKDKYYWLAEKHHQGAKGIGWSLDLDADFVLNRNIVKDYETGEELMIPIRQVIMINSSLDAVEAKERGIVNKGRTGIQRQLDDLGLPLEGERLKYYMIGTDEKGNLLGIPYDYQEEYIGHFSVDCIEISSFTGEVRLIRKKVGIYNPLLRKFMKFGH